MIFFTIMSITIVNPNINILKDYEIKEGRVI